MTYLKEVMGFSNMFKQTHIKQVGRGFHHATSNVFFEGGDQGLQSLKPGKQNLKTAKETGRLWDLYTI